MKLDLHPGSAPAPGLAPGPRLRLALPASAIALALATALPGCGSYEARPLDPARILRDLEGVRLAALGAGGREAPSPAPPGPGGGAAPAPPSGTAAARLDPSDGLTGDEAVAVALALNPGLRAFRAERGVAEGELVAAGVLPNPELAVTWLYIDDFTRTLGTSGFDVALQWAPPRPGEPAAKEERARARIAAVEAEVAAREWRLAAEVRSAVAGAEAAEERLRMTAALLSLQDRLREAVRRREAIGDASRLDVSLVEIEGAAMGRERAVAAGERDQARLALNRLLGLPPQTEVRLQPEGPPLAVPPAPPDAEPLLSLMLERRGDLRAARAEYERAEADLRLAYLQRIPWFRFGPSYSRDELDGKGGDRFGIGLAIDLPIANMNEGEIAIREAARERLREAFTALVHEARAEVHEALARLRSAQGLVRLEDATVRPALDEAARLIEEGLRAGELDIVRLTAVQDRVWRARRDGIDARLSGAKAWFELERAVGARLERKRE